MGGQRRGLGVPQEGIIELVMNPWGDVWRPDWLEYQDKVRWDPTDPRTWRPGLIWLELCSLSETSHRENNALAVFNLSPITPRGPGQRRPDKQGKVPLGDRRGVGPVSCVL